MGFHDENPDVVTMYLWYRWGERASHNALNQYWVGGAGTLGGNSAAVQGRD